MIEVEGMTFGYEDSVPLLQDWSAEFSGGEMVAITGPSGTGKSTLLYILGLMLKPESGRMVIGGQDVSHLRDVDRAELRADLFGFVFQDASLDTTRSVLDNVLETTLYRGTSRRAETHRAIQLLEQFGVALRAEARPGQVSGGQAQRIALCRALLSDPRVLLADEPTGNLDPTSSGVVVDAMREHARSGAAVVVVTHDPAVVAQCDRSIQLS